MKILVPTDFSDLSKVAIEFAARFASHTNNPLLIVHNVILESVPRAGVLINLEEKMEQNATEDLNNLAKWVKTQVDPAPDIFCEIMKMSNSAQGIMDKAKTGNAGLIVMGTKGSSGISGAILGSVSSEVARKSTLPVILVPAHATFGTDGIMVLAIDPTQLPADSTILEFYSLCKKFSKIPEFFFAGSNGNEKNITDCTTHIQQLLPTVVCRFHTHPGNDPVDAINDFTSHNKTMMLALVPSQLSFFDRVFGKSVTTRIMAHSDIPVVALP